jgi:hypothetical protein
MKDAYYFSHDSNAKDDPKIMLLIDDLGLEGYGIYWVLIELLRDQPDYRYELRYTKNIARKYGTSQIKVEQVIARYNLFVIDDGIYFYSMSLINRMEKLDNLRKARSNAGKKGNEVRWNKLSQSDTKAIANGLPSDRKASLLNNNITKHITTEQIISNNNNNNGQEQVEKSVEKNVVKPVVEKNVVAVSEIDSIAIETTQKKIESIGSINKGKVKELIEKYGTENINLYLDNFSKFNVTKNPVGFLIKAIENAYDIPAAVKKNNGQPVQSANFTQREFSQEEADIFENWYMMNEDQKKEAELKLQKRNCKS